MSIAKIRIDNGKVITYETSSSRKFIADMVREQGLWVKETDNITIYYTPSSIKEVTFIDKEPIHEIETFLPSKKNKK
jgi:hypothetical protein